MASFAVYSCLSEGRGTSAVPGTFVRRFRRDGTLIPAIPQPWDPVGAPDQRLACEEANMISPVWDTGKVGSGNCSRWRMVRQWGAMTTCPASRVGLRGWLGFLTD